MQMMQLKTIIYTASWMKKCVEKYKEKVIGQSSRSFFR